MAPLFSSRARKNLAQGFPLDEGHCIIDIGRGRLDGQNRDDRGVAQRAGDLGLPQKAALDDLLFLQFGADPLQGDLAAASGIFG